MGTAAGTKGEFNDELNLRMDQHYDAPPRTA